MPETPSALPYRDTKPVGAADFYFAINATFRFILNKMGLAGLHRYWGELGTSYFRPVSGRWQSEGLAGIATYWRAFFAAEPGAEVEVQETSDAVTIEVKTCPSIKHLRDHRREIVGCFCQHCYFVNEAIAAPAGFSARVAGGNGSCRQIFRPRDAATPQQDLAEIKEAGC
jgi:hypothetical protein